MATIGERIAARDGVRLLYSPPDGQWFVRLDGNTPVSIQGHTHFRTRASAVVALGLVGCTVDCYGRVTGPERRSER